MLVRHNHSLSFPSPQTDNDGHNDSYEYDASDDDSGNCSSSETDRIDGAVVLGVVETRAGDAGAFVAGRAGVAVGRRRTDRAADAARVAAAKRVVVARVARVAGRKRRAGRTP